ncbi:MAG: thioredoxin [Holosporales bacterium]|nr:thioredoxin [Holosporales bacterium]
MVDKNGNKYCVMRQVKNQNFEKEVLNSAIPVVVDFAAEWCPPCRTMVPLLDELFAELAGKVDIVKVNIDESPELAGKYGVMSIPTMILFKGGKQTSSIVGGHSKAKIAEWINSEISL